MPSLDNCNSKPFIRLGDADAPILNYNLPQRSCFSVFGKIPFVVPVKLFKESCLKAPERSPILNKDIVVEDIAKRLKDHLVATKSGQAMLKAAKTTLARNKSLNSIRPALLSAEASGTLDPVTMIASKIKEGFYPVVTRRGNQQDNIEFRPLPNLATPVLCIVETYRVCSYLGDYGAGKTLNVFSLLPGEKTSITIKTYQTDSETRTLTENVLDSHTETASDEFENTLREETGTSVTETNSSTLTTSSSIEGDLGIHIKKVFEAGVSAGAESGFTEDKQITTSNNVNTIAESITRHVSSSSQLREIEVNSSTTTTSTSGTENAIVREIENINRSRVLNFVFRQLLQEYITLTVLTDVKIVYTNGYPESNVVMSFSDLEQKLGKLLVTKEAAKEVRDKIVKEYCTVYNYKGEPKQFLENITRTYGDCGCLPVKESRTICRKNESLTDMAEGITVEGGVIMKVQKHILKTPAVIVDALMGQGEALDCYNQHLQNAAVDKANLENRQKLDALNTLGAITDPVERSIAYKRMFGTECCSDESADA